MDDDCLGGKCCSRYGYCGTGQDYCKPPRCQTVEVTLKGGALEAHGGNPLGQGPQAPLGPLLGFYNRSIDMCHHASWTKEIRFNNIWYRDHAIWFHVMAGWGDDPNECGKKVSKGQFRNYWKIGNIESKLGVLDTYDKDQVNQDQGYNTLPYSYDHRQAAWSYWDILAAGAPWIGPTLEISVDCVLFEEERRGDGPCK